MTKTKQLFFGIAALVVLGLLIAAPVGAVKPSENLAAAQEVPWYLSADVMPVPPYGSGDISGSDTASKLIVNQPNGNTEVALTGVMNGLSPNTVYTVYLSKAYTPYTPLSIKPFTSTVLGTYMHDIVITTVNPDGSFSGTGGYPAGDAPYTDSGQTPETITGQITGNQISLTTVYAGPYNPGYTVTALGTVAADGSMSGSVPWAWQTTPGAVTLASGSTGWPGLFTSTVPAFTFTTDEFGSGSWHINLRDGNFTGSGSYLLSVWINGAGRTILVSDNFNILVG